MNVFRSEDHRDAKLDYFPQPSSPQIVIQKPFWGFAMDHIHTSSLQALLLHRRNRLQEFIREERKTPQLVKLVQEVESALERLNDGTYGRCEICQENIEEEYLHSEPLVRVCLSHLSETQQRAIERDLQLASQIQNKLLPLHNLLIDGWETSYHYEPLGPVSRDYCDIVKTADGSTHFFFGDVSGKGVAASLLVSHLHAMFRTLLSSNQPLHELVARANRLFCESTLSANFAAALQGWMISLL
jgi:sigma-B regulation protein RsbU (phosphoserine phosphatase)